MHKRFELDSLKIVEAFAFSVCRNVQKVKVKKYRMENISYSAFKWYKTFTYYVINKDLNNGRLPDDVGEVLCIILQPLHRFTYVTAHSTTLPLLHLRHLASRPWFKSSENRGVCGLNLCKKMFCLFVSNANPLHYYVLRVPRKANRWRWVWSIFNSRSAWADHITYGTSRPICIV